MEKVMEFEELKRVRTLMWYINKPLIRSNLLLSRTHCKSLDTFMEERLGDESNTRCLKICLINRNINFNSKTSIDYFNSVPHIYT